VGGRFGHQLKRCGLDGIIVTGKSDIPLGLEISGSAINLETASHLKGLTLDRRFEILKEWKSAAAVGPAAENCVRFSTICVDGHFFSGRNGLGLVMARKGLAYIALSGEDPATVAHRDRLKKAREDIFRMVNASPVLKGMFGIATFGTGALYDLINQRRMMPTDNFRRTWFEDSRKLNAPAYRERYGSKSQGCAGCHIQCKKRSQDGRVLPEFETMSHFTALVDNRDMETVVEANRLCNIYGMDTISAAATLACYSELTGRRLLPDDILRLLQEIGTGRGDGPELAAGSLEMARNRGMEGSAMQVKGLELPAYDPRGAYGLALAYATSPRGGCHLRAYPVSHEILRKPVATDRFSFDGKARIIRMNEDTCAVFDSLTACKFISFGAGLEEYAEVLSAVTGLDVSARELMGIGERIVYQERMINTANGFDRSRDTLPERFFREPGTGGEGIEVPPLDRERFGEALSAYYSIRGLTPDGIPVREKAEELELEWTIS
jgi:aldehyde:ferredoxin oxidoreductase